MPQAVHRQIPILVRTMGSSLDLLETISDPPNGSENLLMQVYCLTTYNFSLVWNFWYILNIDNFTLKCQVLHTLTDGTVPSKDLISTVKRLHDSKLKVLWIVVLEVSRSNLGLWLIVGWLYTGRRSSYSCITIPIKWRGTPYYSFNWM